LPGSATTLARSIDGADAPTPNVLSARHLSRIGGGQLFAATSNVPWTTLLARTFDVDVNSCARCGGRREVRAVVTDRDIARKILDAKRTASRVPPRPPSSTNPRSRDGSRSDGLVPLRPRTESTCAVAGPLEATGEHGLAKAIARRPSADTAYEGSGAGRVLMRLRSGARSVADIAAGIDRPSSRRQTLDPAGKIA